MEIAKTAKYLHYPAMPENEQFGVKPYRQLITGVMRSSSRYRVSRPRGSGDILLILTLAGAGYFGRRQTKSELVKGTIILVPKGIPHDYGIMPNRKSWSIIWAHFRPWPHWAELMRWPDTNSGAQLLRLNDPAVFESVATTLRGMHQSAVSAFTHREIWAMNLLEQALLLCDQANPLQPANRLDSRIQAVLEHVNHHLAEELAVEDLAGVAGLSPSRFAHLFSKETGTTPLRYIESQRINRACDLLALTSSPVAEVGESVGIPDPYYFSRRFRKAVGLSPRAYRHQVATEVRG